MPTHSRRPNVSKVMVSMAGFQHALRIHSPALDRSNKIAADARESAIWLVPRTSRNLRPFLSTRLSCSNHADVDAEQQSPKSSHRDDIKLAKRKFYYRTWRN